MGQSTEVGRQRHRLGTTGLGSPGGATQLRRQDRAQEGRVGAAPGQLLGHEGDLDRRRPRGAVLVGAAQLPPSGLDHGGIELGGPLLVVEAGHRARTEPADHRRRGVAQRQLLRRQSDVHQGVPLPGPPAPASARRATSGGGPSPRGAGGWRRPPPRDAAACRWRADRRPARPALLRSRSGRDRPAPPPPAPRRPRRRGCRTRRSRGPRGGRAAPLRSLRAPPGSP
jgi:hypothetical protein